MKTITEILENSQKLSREQKNELATDIERKLIQEALDVQDACNLSGVVHSFSDTMHILWDVARLLGKGTAWVNQHRISRMWASKIQSLTGDTIPSDWDQLS